MGNSTQQHGDKDVLSNRSDLCFREIQIEFLIHEMKDPVSIIETGARALLEKREKYGSLSERQERTLRRILRSVKKAQGMLNDLLEIGRSESGYFMCRNFCPVPILFEVSIDALETMTGERPEPIGSSRGNEECVQFLSDNGVFLNFDSSVLALEIFQDEVKFRQIVGNLIKNAIYHRTDRIYLKMSRNRGNLVVEVADDGPGIEPEHYELIFQRYGQVCDRTLSRKGHGIGLAGALIFARSIGGDIEVASEGGRGAVFRLTLPLRMEKGR